MTIIPVAVDGLPKVVAFTFVFGGERYIARSTDPWLTLRVSCALEGEDGVSQVCDILERESDDPVPAGVYRLVDLDGTFDVEMTPRELFRGIDALLSSLGAGPDNGATAR